MVVGGDSALKTLTISRLSSPAFIVLGSSDPSNAEHIIISLADTFFLVGNLCGGRLIMGVGEPPGIVNIFLRGFQIFISPPCLLHLKADGSIFNN